MNHLRKFLCLVLLSTIAAVSSPARALDIGAMGSFWSIEDGDGTWGAGVSLGLPIFSDYIKPEIRAYWFPDIDDAFDGKVDVIPVDIGPVISFNPKGRFNPFITGGTGYVFVDSDRYDEEGDIGYYAGGGLEIGLFGPVELFSEVMYRWFEFDLNDRLSDDRTIEMNGLTVNVGMQLDF